MVKRAEIKKGPVWFRKGKSIYCYPGTWHGWAVTLFYILGISTILTLGREQFELWETQLFYVWLPVIGLSSLFAIVVYSCGWRTGPAREGRES